MLMMMMILVKTKLTSHLQLSFVPVAHKTQLLHVHVAERDLARYEETTRLGLDLQYVSVIETVYRVGALYHHH